MMKKRKRSAISVGTFGVCTLFIMLLCSGCWEKGVQSETYWFTVQKSNDERVENRWTWDDVTGRYECVFYFPELSGDVYNYGVVTAAVETWESWDFVSLKTLPYVRTYYDEQRRTNYTETISYDISNNPGTICFFIQTNKPDEIAGLLSNYDFKVTLLWDED